jgi:hypothetical protein
MQHKPEALSTDNDAAMRAAAADLVLLTPAVEDVATPVGPERLEDRTGMHATS